MQVPVNIVGGSTFGRYPKISLSKTYNMFVSDDWLVNYPGYKKQIHLIESATGRGLFASSRGNIMIAVVSSSVFRINIDMSYSFIASLDTSNGYVSIDENLNGQICIADGLFAYIYNYLTNQFVKLTLSYPGGSIKPGYVCYHNTFFIFGSSKFSQNPQNWYVFEYESATSLKFNSQFAIQTKPDSALAVKRLPGKGNNVLAIGSTVCEVWTNVGGTENYRRIQSFNIDLGCVSTSTIAANEDFVCWLAENENNAPFLMYSDGSSSKRISSDGIDYVLSTLNKPEKSTAFFYRQDGHLFYQITFYDPSDNLTLVYDFSNGKFFHATDENLHYYPAAQNAFFNDSIYFVSLNDGCIYIMDTNYIDYNYDTTPGSVGQEIPRIRICDTIRKPDSDRFRCGMFSFWIEQGVVTSSAPTPSRIDMSFSKNGNQSFSNVVSKQMNPQGVYRNQVRYWRMGHANEMTIQLRFYGFQRFVVNNGVLETYE